MRGTKKGWSKARDFLIFLASFYFSLPAQASAMVIDVITQTEEQEAPPDLVEYSDLTVFSKEEYNKLKQDSYEVKG